LSKHRLVMTLSLIILAIIGIVLSIYALYVERKAKADMKYKAICDLSDRMSCSAAFRSDYGKIFFGIPNSAIGIAAYLVLLILALANLNQYIFYLSIIAVLATIYLAYALFIKLKNICLVCIGIYIINVLFLILSYIEVY